MERRGEPLGHTTTKMAAKWDVHFAIFCFQKLSERIVSENGVSQQVLGSLRTLSTGFAANNAEFENSLKLSAAEEETFELHWASLIRFSKNGALSDKNRAIFKFCLFQIGHCIMLTRRRSTDVEFGTHLLAFGLDAMKDCLKQRFLEEAFSILQAAEGFCVLESPEIAVETFQAFSHLFLVYRVLYLSLKEPVNETAILEVIKTIKDPSELEDQQLESIAGVCFNVGLRKYRDQLFDNAITWLRIALKYSESRQDENSSSSQKTMTLLASCYLKLDDHTSRWNALDILNFAEENRLNLEMKLNAMMDVKKDAKAIADCAFKYFQLLAEEDEEGRRVESAVERVFAVLEHRKEYGTLDQILERIPWRSDSQSEDQTSVMHLKWICARYAVRSCSARKSFDDIYDLLRELPQWTAADGDAEIVEEIVTEAERVALRYLYEEHNPETAHEWYETLVILSHFYRIPSSVLWNAVSFALSTGDAVGFTRAKRYLQQIPETQDRLEHLCIRLQIALKDNDVTGALQLTKKIDKSESLAVHWLLIRSTIAQSVSAALEQNQHSFMTDYLTSVLKQSLQNALKCAALTYILWIGLNVLRNADPSNGEQIRDQHLQHIIATFRNAYETIQLVESRPHFKIGSPEQGSRIDEWFAVLAWNMGRQAVRSAHFRHHFFRFSYKFFRLTLWNCAQSDAVMEHIETAMVASMLAGLKIEIEDHSILQTALETTEEFFELFQESCQSQLVCLIEVKLLCQLRLEERLHKRFDVYTSKSQTIRFDADFFESLAAIVAQSEMGGYKRIVTFSLRMAMQKTPEEQPIPRKHVTYWRWLIQNLFQDITWEETLNGDFLDFMEQLAAFVRKLGPRYPTPELRWLVKRIWSSFLLLRRPRSDLKRWTEYCKNLVADSAPLRQYFDLQFKEYLDLQC